LWTSLEEKDVALLRNSSLTATSDSVLAPEGCSSKAIGLLDKETLNQSCQKVKSIFSSESHDIGSTGTSDKSSFGSESNDSSGDMASSGSDAVLPVVTNGFANPTDQIARQFREASQSPAFFG